MRRFLVLLWLVVPVALAQGTLEVISLRNRTAEQVIQTPSGNRAIWVKVEELR